MENFVNIQNKNQLIIIKEEIKSIILNNIQDKFLYQSIFDKISSILSLIQESFKDKIQTSMSQYESLIKRDEQTIRILYKSLLTYKLMKDSLDNRIRLLLIKEKEYELIKEKTGAYFRNGEIIYNKQKDNEITILRAENSNLKNIIDNYEKIIKEKDLLYEKLKIKYNNIQLKLSKIKEKKFPIPNININLNDSPHLNNINNNSYSCSINFHNSKKSWNNSDTKNFKNFNYMKYKNNFKMNKNIHVYNSISLKNIFQNSLSDLNPKDIFGAKQNKSNLKNNDKKLDCKNQRDICSLKKKNIKIGDSFQNHFSENHFNLLQAYTANSSKSLNKSLPKKKLSTYSNEVKISSYYTKNNHSQKINKKGFSQKQKNRESFKSEHLQKSYINYIPFNKEKDNFISKIKDNKNNKCKLIYNRAKIENNDNKKDSKNKINIDINKIFLPSNIKKKRVILKK